MIPYGRQDISNEDIESVIETLKSEFITQGPKVLEFEEAVNKRVGSSYAVAANSATSCLHLACKALELKDNEWVWTSPNSFVASANAALYCKANIDFVDIDPNTYNMSCEKLEEKLAVAKKNNLLPKIIIPVHFGGQSCDMEKIFQLSKEYGFKIIEDASHAIGGEYKGKKIGCCEYSSITVFSFHPVKIITTAEGGIATTNDRILAKKMAMDRTHGIERLNQDHIKNRNSEIWNYQQNRLGFNYRLNDLQASLGISQLKRLNEFIIKRNKIAEFYNKNLSSTGIQLPHVIEDSKSSYHLYPIRVSLLKGGINQKKLFYELRNNNIGVNLHYIPIYRQPYFRKLGFKKGYCEEAERYFKEVISIPIFSKLKNIEQQNIVKIIKEICSDSGL